MKARISIAVVALLVTMASGALAQDRRDVRLAEDVGRSMTGYVRLTIFDDINATVENGMVVLTGKVTMPYKKDDLEKRIAKIDGVRSVKNDIGVLPVSQFDDELRYRVSRAIYGNPSFWNYAAMANPPIHVIVEGGHVTLAGVVNSNVERMLARSLATGLGELSVTNALRLTRKSEASSCRVRGRPARGRLSWRPFRRATKPPKPDPRRRSRVRGVWPRRCSGDVRGPGRWDRSTLRR
jgi:osmotically-inducible protein OsmY